MRWILTLASVLVFLAGVQLFVFPRRTDTYFAWTIDPPMTAVFLGASYWSAIALELAAARAGRWRDARIAVPAVFVFTTITLVITLVHLDRFHTGAEHAGSTRAVAWAWLVIYATVPVLMVLAMAAQVRRARTERVGNPTGGSMGETTAAEGASGAQLRAWVRAGLVVLTVVFGGVGVALLASPTGAGDRWPWTLTPLTARAVGAWLVGLAVATAHAWLLDDAREVRPLALTGVSFGILQGIALARCGDDVDWSGAPAAIYVGALVLLFVLSAATLVGDRTAHQRPRA